MIASKLTLGCYISIGFFKALKKKKRMVVKVTGKPVLRSHRLGMAYRPLNTGWPYDTGLTNVRVTQENEGGQRLKYLSHDKLTSTCIYVFSAQKKKS